MSLYTSPALRILRCAELFRTRPLSNEPDMCVWIALTQTHVMYQWFLESPQKSKVQVYD